MNRVRSEAVNLLNQQLADAIDLTFQAKQAHWNVKGPSFIALHELFDEVVREVEGYVDELAERAVELGGAALGTVRVAARASRLLPTLSKKAKRLATCQQDVQSDRSAKERGPGFLPGLIDQSAIALLLAVRPTRIAAARQRDVLPLRGSRPAMRLGEWDKLPIPAVPTTDTRLRFFALCGHDGLLS